MGPQLQRPYLAAFPIYHHI